MALQQELFNNMIIVASTTAYSQPVDIGANSNVFVGLTFVAGTTGITGAELEGSADLSNWSDLSISWLPAIFAAAPSYSRGTISGIATRYVRLRIDNSTADICANATLSATGA